MPASKRKTENVTNAPSPICLALQKFSHATVLQNSVGPLPWNHIVSHGDIFALFETIRVVGTDGTMRDSKRFKIVQDPNVMEDLDLEVLATETGRAIDMARDASDHNRDHNAAVIKKVPVVAVKYPMSGRQVKRFQIRFTTDSDYYEALKQFAQAGVHMLEAGTFPSNRPQTAQQSYHVERTQLAPRPMTAVHNSPAAISALDAVGQVTDAGSKLAQPYGIHSLSHNTSLQVQYNHPQVASSRSANAQASILQTIDDYGHKYTDANASSDSQHVTAPLKVAPQTVPTPSTRPAAIDLYTPRPSTAPAHVSQHLSQMLPPKRELPFNPPSTAFAQSTKAAALEGHGLQYGVAGRENCNDVLVETIIPNSQELETTISSKKTKPTTTTASSKKRTTQSRDKSTGKFSAQPRSKKCDACKKKGARTRCRHKQDSPQLPSIEEVFEPDTTAAGMAPVDSKLDTQALLSRAAQAQKAATNRSAAKDRTTSIPPSSQRMTRSMSIAAKDTAVDQSRSAVDPRPTKSAQKQQSTFPCTPAEQLINPTTPTTPPVQAPVPIASQPPPPTPSQAQTHLAKYAEAVHEHTIKELNSVLASQPAFTGADKKLAVFANLAPKQQQETLEQWCIQMYKNPDFRVLCRALDATHRAQLAITL